MTTTSPTTTPTTVMVCTDGSERGIVAIEAGLPRLAAHERVVLVTVLDPPDESLVTGVSGFGAGSLTPEQYDELDRQRRTEAAALLDETARRTGLTDAERLLLEGAPGPAICDMAEELGADVIVMGSRGHGGLRRAVLGSVSDHVVRHAPCPVLITNVHDHDT
jgi:nucleotide-binding universal stress UspA family protein